MNLHRMSLRGQFGDERSVMAAFAAYRSRRPTSGGVRSPPAQPAGVVSVSPMEHSGIVGCQVREDGQAHKALARPSPVPRIPHSPLQSSPSPAKNQPRVSSRRAGQFGLPILRSDVDRRPHEIAYLGLALPFEGGG